MDAEFDFEQEENVLIEKATRRKQEESEKQLHAAKAYRCRKDILLNYFLRMSAINKEKFIKALVDHLTNVNDLLMVASCLSIGDAKAFAYYSVEPQTNFKYDEMVTDHDRMLDEKDIAEAVNYDSQWFKNLDSDQKVDIIISLIKISGGTIQGNIFLPLYKKWFHAMDVRNSEYDIIKASSRKSRSLVDDECEEYGYSDHPASIEVENQRRNWYQTISKYREKVETMTEMILKIGKQKSNVGKEKKTKQMKSKELKKDGQSKEFGSAVDWIQLLPIWIVKKIFTHFDQKTLQKIKKVNSYWSYVVQDVIKERKMRVQMNKEIEKLEAAINPTALEEAFKIEASETLTEMKRKPHKRFINYKRGAMVKTLIPKLGEVPLVKTSLVSEATEGVTEEFLSENIASFPRQIVADTELYKYEPCSLRDVDVVLGELADVKLHESFLTYSVSTQSSTLNISIDRQTLEEW